MVSCESCGTKVPNSKIEEFMGCDDGDLRLCKGCNDAAWAIPAMFGGSLGLKRTRAINLIRVHRHLDPASHA